MMLVRPRRCLGCRRCVIACKSGNSLEVDEYRMTVQTFADEVGIENLLEEQPILKMTWQPKFFLSCTFCTERNDADLPLCVAECPVKALVFGDAAETISTRESTPDTAGDAGHVSGRFVSLPASAKSRDDVLYEIG